MDTNPYTKKLEWIDTERRRAAINYDAEKFATYCILEGTEPEKEYQGLYEQGVAQIIDNPTDALKLEDKINKILHGSRQPSILPRKKEKISEFPSNFIKEAKEYNTNIGMDIAEKTKCLMKYFPRFRPGENDDLTKEEYLRQPLKIGVKFNNILRWYEDEISGRI
ncbi:MAG: hypothetical protein ACP5NW_03320 [Candidatus Woesearchaeota archaeon]